MSAPADSNGAQSRDVARELVQLIQADGLDVGDRLPSIRELARQFEASASTVRDALLHAETMGLVRILPRSGAFVQAVDCSRLVSAFSETLDGSLVQMDHHIFHLLEARMLIEVECARQAATRRRLEELLPLRESLDAMDDALRTIGSPQSEQARSEFVEADIHFHMGIAQICGNPVLLTMLRSLLNLLRAYLTQIPWNAERKRVTQEAHIDLYEALLHGRADAAAELMGQHLQLARDGLLKRVWPRRSSGDRNPGAAAGAVVNQAEGCEA